LANKICEKLTKSYKHTYCVIAFFIFCMILNHFEPHLNTPKIIESQANALP